MHEQQLQNDVGKSRCGRSKWDASYGRDASNSRVASNTRNRGETRNCRNDNNSRAAIAQVEKSADLLAILY
jgi:hypothetical protein